MGMFQYLSKSSKIQLMQEINKSEKEINKAKNISYTLGEPKSNYIFHLRTSL